MYSYCPSTFMSEFLAGISMFSLAMNVVIFCFMRPKVVHIQFDQIDLFDTMADHRFVRSNSLAGDDKDSGSESEGSDGTDTESPDTTTSTTTAQSPDSTRDDSKPNPDSYFGYFT